MKNNTKNYAARALVDHFIGPELGDNPTREQIENELEKRRARICQAQSEISQLRVLIEQNPLDESKISDYKELIFSNEDIITINTPIVERLEGALQGKPLYKDSYFEYKKSVQKIFNREDLREKYGY